MLMYAYCVVRLLGVVSFSSVRHIIAYQHKFMLTVIEIILL